MLSNLLLEANNLIVFKDSHDIVAIFSIDALKLYFFLKPFVFGLWCCWDFNLDSLFICYRALENKIEPDSLIILFVNDLIFLDFDSLQMILDSPKPVIW